jgi:hypothetical protein
MKHFKLFATCLMVACASPSFVFTSCEESEHDNFGDSSISDPEINAKIEEGEKSDPKISVVKMVGYLDYEIALGTYSKGGFTINLPAAVDGKYLKPISEIFAKGGSIKYSDSNAKGVSSNLYGFDESGIEVAEFNYKTPYIYYIDGKEEYHQTEAWFLYVDRNVTITGFWNFDNDHQFYFHLSLKNGWNLVYKKRYPDSNLTFFEYTNYAPSEIKWWVIYNEDRYESN